MCKLRLAFQPLLLATKWTCLDCQKAIHAKPIGLHDRNCSRYVRRRNTRCLPVSMTQAATQGKIQYSVVESHKNKYLRIQYKPPVDYFRSGQDLFFTGGYNNWNGIDDPLILPLNQKNTEMYETLVPLPEGSRSIEFAFTDGVVYDTNNGAFYHIPLEQTVTEKQLDTPIESASPNTKVSELDPLKVPEGPSRYTIDEEVALRKARAEATAVGESLGLSNVLMTEARIEFERFDTRLSGWISRQDAKSCLERLGFEISDEKFQELVFSCKRYSRNEDMENIHIMEYIYMYGSLELGNEGLQIL